MIGLVPHNFGFCLTQPGTSQLKQSFVFLKSTYVINLAYS